MVNGEILDRFDVRSGNGNTYLSFNQKTSLTFDSSWEVIHHMEKLAEAIHTETISLDFRNVLAVDSYGIGSLVRLYKVLLLEKRELVFLNVEEKTQSIFTQLGLHRIIRFSNGDEGVSNYQVDGLFPAYA